MHDLGPKNAVGGVCKATLIAGASVFVLTTQAAAQSIAPSAPLRLQTDYLGYGISISPRVSYSTNIDLAPDGFEEDEYALSNAVSAGAIVSAPRITAIFLGEADLSYLVDQDDFVINQDAGGSATFTAIDDWLYFDVAASAQRQLAGDEARISDNLNAARQQRANVYSVFGSPYVFHRLSRESTIEARYAFSQFFVNDSGSDIGGGVGDFYNDSQSHEVLARYDSGDLFNFARFRVGGFGRDTTEDGSDILPRFEYRQASAYVETEYAVTRQLFLTGAVGYDEIELDDGAEAFFDEDALSGFYWRAGMTARPNRRTNFRVEYGERYDGDFIDAFISYDLTNRIRLNARAGRSFQTRTQQIDSRTRLAQVDALSFADRLREGAELNAREVINAAGDLSANLSGVGAQSVGVSVSNEASAGLVYYQDRWNLGVSGRYEDSDFGVREAEVYSAQITANRRLNRATTARAAVRYRSIDSTGSIGDCLAAPLDFGIDDMADASAINAACNSITGGGGTSETLTASVAVSYQLFENIALFGQASHAERFARDSLLEYDETAASVGLTLEF